MTGRTLFEIGEDLEALDALLEELGGDVSDPQAEAAVDEWLGTLGQERDAKLDRYARLIATLAARAEAKKVEAARLLARASTETARASFLRARLLAFLQRHGIKIVETPLHRFTVANNGGRVPVEILVRPEELPEPFRIVVTEVRPNRDAIRAKLEAGEALEFARLGERGVNLRIE